MTSYFSFFRPIRQIYTLLQPLFFNSRLLQPFVFMVSLISQGQLQAAKFILTSVSQPKVIGGILNCCSSFLHMLLIFNILKVPITRYIKIILSRKAEEGVNYANKLSHICKTPQSPLHAFLLIFLLFLQLVFSMCAHTCSTVSLVFFQLNYFSIY